KPIQQLPEIWVGGGGEKVTLRIEAKHADKTNWQTGLEGFVRKSGLLAQYCDEIGRDFDSVVRTHGPDCIVFDPEADMNAWLGSCRSSPRARWCCARWCSRGTSSPRCTPRLHPCRRATGCSGGTRRGIAISRATATTAWPRKACGSSPSCRSSPASRRGYPG